MPPSTLRLTSSSPLSTVAGLPPTPPKQLISNQNLSVRGNQENRREDQRHLVNQLQISRRDAAFLFLISLFPSLCQPSHASAFSIGISGPKEWLKEQKRKSSKFLVAPIDASRQSLRSAYLLLMDKESTKDLEEVQKLLKSAARDCVVQERNSFVAFQASTGVEVCTFRLIVKNASSLLEDKNPVKLEAEAMLDDLISSFTSLNSLANETDIQVSSSRQKVADALMDTISSLDKFEQGVKDCLEV
ncbi:Chloroplast thylakoid membrane [Theobroma cacao]|uniref:Chloroplast thylakoid membrane n=1 Tax=Theobroma cacao TaxID=3641 RepID=A0A061FDJ4_THECC|nr:Chloroplast thylakoid membrane [Theobroma cacao]